jgi:hypothetical protein
VLTPFFNDPRWGGQVQPWGSARDSCFLLRGDLGDVPASLLAFTTPGRAFFHDLAVSLRALFCATAACLGAGLVGVKGQGAGAGHQSRGKNAECLAIDGQFVGFGMVLSMFPALYLEVLEAMMGRLVTRPDALSHDLQVLVVLVALVVVLVLLRLGLVPTSHEQSSRSCPYPTQEFSTVHDCLLLHESECDALRRTVKPCRSARKTNEQLVGQSSRDN